MDNPPSSDDLQDAAPDTGVSARVRGLDLKQLRYFVGVVEAGSISRGASAMHVTQPGLSRRLADLEHTLNAPLLRRGPHGVQVTEQGRALFIVAKRILQDIHSIAYQLDVLGAEPAGDVSVGCANGASSVLAYPLFHAMRERYPKVKLLFSTGKGPELMRRLSSGELDVALISSYKPLAGIVRRALIRERVFVAGAPALLDATEGDIIPLASLKTLPLITPGPSNFAIRDFIFEGQQLPELHITVEVDDWPLQLRLLREGVGCSVLSWPLVADDVAAGRLRIKPLGEPPLERDIELCTSIYRPVSSASEAAVAMMRELATELIRDGRWRHAHMK